jgi:hypothetical protein
VVSGAVVQSEVETMFSEIHIAKEVKKKRTGGFVTRK